MTENVNPVEEDYGDFEESTGAAVMEERAAASGAGGDFTPRLSSSLKEPGDTLVVRPLSLMDSIKGSRLDAWITVGVHNGVATKAAPKDSNKDSWPGALPTVCRLDKALRRRFPDGCPTHNMVGEDGKRVSLKDRTFGLFVVREQVPGEPEGTFRDAVRKYTLKGKDGEPDREETALDIRYGMYSEYNFWRYLTTAAGMSRNVTNRDFRITRKGTGRNTKYEIKAYDPVEVLNPANSNAEAEQDWVVYDLANPAILDAVYPGDALPNLKRIVVGLADDEYLEKWFLGGSTNGAASSKPGPAAPDTTVPSNRLAAARTALRRPGQPAASSEPAQVPAEVPQAAEDPAAVPDSAPAEVPATDQTAEEQHRIEQRMITRTRQLTGSGSRPAAG